MTVRDLLDLRRHRATEPGDADDPARFGQIIETTKDAFVLELRRFLDQQGFTADKREENPTVRKYAIGFGPGTDPYETFTQIVQEQPDILEQLPHVAVTSTTGRNRRMTIGRPFVAHVQFPPRIEGTGTEPFALANPARETWTVTIDAAAPGAYTLTVGGTDYTYTATGSNTVGAIASELARVVREAVTPLIAVAVNGVTATITLTHAEYGEAFAVAVGAGSMTATLVTAASAVTGPDVLVYETTPTGHVDEPVVSRTVFEPRRFATADPITAASAAAVVRVINEQALYAQARTTTAGDGVRVATGGPKGRKTPNQIEVLAESTRNVIDALGLADYGTGTGADAITLVTGNTYRLTVAAAPFTAAMIGRNLTLSDATTDANNGRFPITAVGGAGDTVDFTNPEGVPETFGGEWFVGTKDTWRNTARPVMNRYHQCSELTLTVSVFTESPNTRNELQDLVLAFFSFWLEEQHFTLLGRSVLDEEVLGEEYAISITSDASNAGETDFPRPGDEKSRIYESRIQVPVTAWYYLDRHVTTDAGESLTLEGENVSGDITLTLPS